MRSMRKKCIQESYIFLMMMRSSRIRSKKLDRLYDFNMTRPTQLDKRKEMLKEILHYDIRVEGMSGF